MAFPCNPFSEGPSQDEIYHRALALVQTPLGDASDPVWLDFDISNRDGEYAITFTLEQGAEGRPYAVHATQNIDDAQTWITMLDELGDSATVRMLLEGTQAAYREAEQAGHGDWWWGKEIIRTRALREQRDRDRKRNEWLNDYSRRQVSEAGITIIELADRQLTTA